MTTAEVKAKTSKLVSNNNTLQMYFVLRENSEFTIKKADIENVRTSPAMKKLFIDFLNQEFLEKEDVEVCSLSSADERTNAIYHYDYDEYPQELSIINNFDINTAVELDCFKFGRDDPKSIYGYIIYLGTMENGVVMFKKHYPISLISKSSFMLILKHNQRLEKLEGEDILRFNGSVQLMRVDNQIYVFDIKVLEKNFGFEKLIRKAANETIDTIQNLNLIEDVQVLADEAENISFARKLSKVLKSSPLIKLNIPKEKIIDFTKTTPALANRFKYSSDGSTIRLDTKKSKDDFVKLLNDDYLTSQLTQQYYDVKAKDNLT